MIELKWWAPAIGRIGKYVMNGQYTAWHQVRRPTAIIVERVLHRVSAIDEEKTQRRRPTGCDVNRATDHRHDRPFQSRGADGAPERQGGATGLSASASIGVGGAF